MDSSWWPKRVEELAGRQMTVQRAVELSSDMPRYIGEVESRNLNGIVDDIRNYSELDAGELMKRMLTVAHEDLENLRQGRDWR
ncbi:MAG: hypothetical protein ACREH8_19960 [Opitutaceae bacterium]